jgi:hypothetical protein
MHYNPVAISPIVWFDSFYLHVLIRYWYDAHVGFYADHDEFEDLSVCLPMMFCSVQENRSGDVAKLSRKLCEVRGQRNGITEEGRKGKGKKGEKEDELTRNNVWFFLGVIFRFGFFF